jgi:hypothetical protein
MMSGMEGHNVEGTKENENPMIAIGIAGKTKLNPNIKCAGNKRSAPNTAKRPHKGK